MWVKGKRGILETNINRISLAEREVVPDKILNTFKSVSSSDRTRRMKRLNPEAVMSTCSGSREQYIHLSGPPSPSAWVFPGTRNSWIPWIAICITGKLESVHSFFYSVIAVEPRLSARHCAWSLAFLYMESRVDLPGTSVLGRPFWSLHQCKVPT